jgi:hypothetical protein
MKKLFLSAITLVALCIGACAQTTAKTTPAKTLSVAHTTTKPTTAGATTVEKTTTSAKAPASKPRHKRHFIQKKKTAAAK